MQPTGDGGELSGALHHLLRQHTAGESRHGLQLRAAKSGKGLYVSSIQLEIRDINGPIASHFFGQVEYSGCIGSIAASRQTSLAPHEGQNAHKSHMLLQLSTHINEVC
jgi:hypothetical protein